MKIKFRKNIKSKTGTPTLYYLWITLLVLVLMFVWTSNAHGGDLNIHSNTQAEDPYIGIHSYESSPQLSFSATAREAAYPGIRNEKTGTTIYSFKTLTTFRVLPPRRFTVVKFVKSRQLFSPGYLSQLTHFHNPSIPISQRRLII
jgi:hypothetical protein